MTETTPLKSDAPESTANPSEPVYPKLAATLLAMLGVGTGLAYGSLFLDSEMGKGVRDSKLGLVEAMDLKWGYLSLVLLGRTVAMLNFVPTGYKNGLKGNIRSNPFFFQTADDNKSMVLYREDGFHGKYNRANRSVQHMVENSGAFFAAVGPVGWIFPRQTFGAVLLFCAGRILHQKGYTQGYGKHGIGFVLSLFGILTVEGLALLVVFLL